MMQRFSISARCAACFKVAVVSDAIKQNHHHFGMRYSGLRAA
jgi:hypothetical protein